MPSLDQIHGFEPDQIRWSQADSAASVDIGTFVASVASVAFVGTVASAAFVGTVASAGTAASVVLGDIATD